MTTPISCAESVDDARRVAVVLGGGSHLELAALLMGAMQRPVIIDPLPQRNRDLIDRLDSLSDRLGILSMFVDEVEERRESSRPVIQLEPGASHTFPSEPLSKRARRRLRGKGQPA